MGISAITLGATPPALSSQSKPAESPVPERLGLAPFPCIHRPPWPPSVFFPRVQGLAASAQSRPSDLTQSVAGSKAPWAVNQVRRCVGGGNRGTNSLTFHSSPVSARPQSWLLNAQRRSIAEVYVSLSTLSLPSPAFPLPVTQLHNDARYWLEQAFDPSHANFLHVRWGCVS